MTNTETGPGGRQLGIVNIISVILVGVAVLLGIVVPVQFGNVTFAIFEGLSKYCGWWYLLATNIFVIFAIFLACSRFGKLTLGKADEKPEFSTLSWFAMLFGAGHGVGLVFYGVGEPLAHFLALPYGSEPGSSQAAIDAMRASLIHWGLHPWACYGAVALCLAYFQFRKGAPGLMSSLFYPWLGKDASKTPIGRAVDILAVIATVAGVATSLGLACLQINSGLNTLFNIPNNMAWQMAIMITLGLCYIFCTISGLDKGIKRLADANMWLCIFLALALLCLGPSLTIVETLMTGIGAYISNFIRDSFDLAPYGGTYKDWLRNWTLYYWAWWIAWSPFVGSFVARISRGRTVRQFVAGVLLVPTLGSFVWFGIFGGTGLSIQMSGAADLAAVVKDNISMGIYSMYAQIPLGYLMSVLMVILLAVFFVTSASASTFVLGMYTSEGMLNPGKTKLVVWGSLLGALTLVLLMTGGMKALQTASLAAAFPFSIIMVLACWCLWSALNKDFAEGQEVH